MAIIARRLTGCGIVFDIRGLMAEEYVDAGRWKHKSLPWKITKWVERIAIESSDACVVLTPAARDMLFGKSPSTHVAVIPCCADLDRLRSGMSQRERMRDALGLHDKTVAVYVGKFGGWYLQREMVEFVAAAQNEIEGLHFLVVTQDAPAMIESYLEGAKIDRSAYTITEVPPARMGAVLAASDFGLSFIAPLPSKVASSPTKLGEYLGAGIPVVFTAGAGHLDEPMVHLRAGVMLSELSRAGYRQAAIEIKTLINDPETPRRSIAVAKSNLSLQHLGIPRYDGLYGEVARLRQV
jgi:hypothetical protein